MVFTMALVLTSCSAFAQFDLGGNAVGFRSGDGATYDIEIEPAGFVFDDNLTHYTPSIPTVNSSVAESCHPDSFNAFTRYEVRHDV